MLLYPWEKGLMDKKKRIEGWSELSKFEKQFSKLYPLTVKKIELFFVFLDHFKNNLKIDWFLWHFRCKEL
jgi:hypothetical protein